MLSCVVTTVFVCVLVFCWRWKNVRLLSIAACLVLQIIIWWPVQSDEATDVVSSAKRAIDCYGKEVPRDHWILPQDHNHEFKDGPALHLEVEDFWQSFHTRPELSQKLTTFIAKDKDGIRIVQKIGEHRKKFYVDKNGKRSFDKFYEFARPFSEGFAAVSNEVLSPRAGSSAGLRVWQFINRNGDIAFPGKFEEVSQFYCGRAAVIPVSSSTNSQPAKKNVERNGPNTHQIKHPIYIDTRGQRVFGGDFTWVGEFSDGCAPVFTEGKPDRTGLVDLKGTFLICGFKFENFSEGLGAFKDTKTGLYGFADRKGIVRIRPQFQYANSFHEGLAVVGVRRKGEIPNWQREQLTLIEQSGRVPSSQCDGEEFDGRIAAAYITKQGKLLDIKLQEPKADIKYAQQFHHGTAYIDLYTDRDVFIDLGLDERLKAYPPRFQLR
ncbi:MAG: hypothetical protein DKT66_23315 [Candidatus Melainabacteria bacterium]|nr:MAG: hypothetical protein DKT66_23315 [Candidatus Melainabacteria bacterium]